MNVTDLADVATTASAPRRLTLPDGVDRRRIAWPNAIALVGYHAVALLAVLPWLFSWTGVVLAILGLYVFGTLGINLCYHRLLAHRGLVVPVWLEHGLAILGVCCMQDTPARWVAIHRRHHEHADERADPHSPLVNFFWGHMGWLLLENTDLSRLRVYERYARDILRDRFYARLERNRWLVVVLASWLVFFLGGFAAALALGVGTPQAIQFAASVLVWGVFVRTVLVWHITWSVNSVTHLWGYRNYETDEASRNNVFVGLISNGEGWHNNHHVCPRSARHGHHWWELDVTWLTIRLLGLIGLARRIATPPPHLTASPAPARVKTLGDPGIVELKPGMRCKLVLRRVRFAAVLACLALAYAPAGAADLPPGYWPREKSQALIDKMRRVRLAPDLSQLGPGERTALAKLLEVGRIFQTLDERQEHHQAEPALVALRDLDRQHGGAADTANLLTLYRKFQGPIAELLDNTREAFLPVDAVTPGKNVYPWGIDKAEIDAWLAAHPDQRAAILGPRTVVRRADAATLRQDAARLARHPVLALLHPRLADELARLAAAPDPKTLYALPYSVAYADEMLRVFILLNEAAEAIAREDEDFARYLRNRARDLLSDDYESGDAAWVNGRFKHFDAQIGAYETYDDELFGNKAFLGVSLMVERAADTAALREALKDLQALEESLPYAPHKRVRQDIPVGIYDVIADFGDARGGNTATILPNESYLVRRYGRRIMIRSNILRHPELFAQKRELWAAVVAPAHRDDFSLDGEFLDTLWHEIGHYLGVDRTRDGRDLHVALEADADVIEEMKADLVSLFVGESLRRQGYYDDAKLRALYAAGIRRALVDAKPRRDQVYETMQLMQWNFFLENGLLAFDRDSGTLRIDYGKYHQVIGKLLALVFDLQAQGDKAAADRFIAQYTVWDEKLHEIIARKLRDTARYRYTLYTYGALGE